MENENLNEDLETQPKKSHFLIYLGLFLVVSLALLFFIQKAVKQPVTIQNNVVNFPTSPTPTVFDHNFTTLAFNPANVSLKEGQSQNLNLLISTNTNTVIAVQLNIKFDPSAISISSVSPAGFFDQPSVLLNQLDNEKGTLQYAIGAQTPKLGNGNLITLVITGKKSSGSTVISYVDNPQIAALNEGSINVLKTADTATINLTPVL